MKLNMLKEGRGLSSSSFDLYEHAVNSFMVFCSSREEFDCWEELLGCFLEEQKECQWCDRRVKSLLMGFRSYLFEEKSFNTANTYFSKVKTVLRFFDVEVGELPPFCSRQFRAPVKCFEDIPSREQIQCALNVCSDMEVRAIILLAVSSGLSRVDILNLTVKDFLIACGVYDEDKSLEEQLDYLEERIAIDDKFIAVFKGYRQKTNNLFITFTHPGVIKNIIICLKQRVITNSNEKLFTISKNQLTYQLRKINDKCDFGRVNYARKFRMHQLRAFHASTLVKNNVFTMEEVDTLQGRVKDRTHRSYFLEDPEFLKRKYLSVVDELTFL